MQVTDLTSQLEAARSALVHLHTRLTTATKKQQADASQQNRRVQQLEVEQAALNSKLDSLTITLNSSQHKNASAICDMRSTMNTFLDKLISIVVQQFGKLQAALAESQADEIKAAVQIAVHEACSTEAGNSILEQLVHRAVADLAKQELGHQISEEAGNGALTSQDGSPHKNKARGIHNDSRSQAAHVQDTCSQAVYPMQKQALGDGLYKPAENQDAAMGKGAFQALRPIPAGKLPVARSQDSLSLMHHASTAGRRTSTSLKSDSTRWTSSGQSPTDKRQALVEIDLNQKGQERERHEEQLRPEPVLPQQPSTQHRHLDSSRQSKQLRWVDTGRHLHQQLLQDSQQAAASSQSAASYGSIAPQHAEPGGKQLSGQGVCGAATMHQDESTHNEELYGLAQILEPTRIAQLQQLPSLVHTMTAQGVTPSSGCKAPWSYDPHFMVNIARSCGGSHTPGYREYASERRNHMQPPFSVTGFANADCQASECQQHTLRQTFVAECYGSPAVTGSMHRQPGVHCVVGSDLSAGIPFTPDPRQQPQPRDSLEASIWKLSGGRRQHAKMWLP